uniref:heterogeneous nuclear ribonucleoprotein Q n=1 Tax=Erigeron canadensis TaxID=72917 RepID=UPI001CB921F1|nr:heterogeneous nuclear ribonucleoprotein Q [Erigeron canadensis]XP_043632669.1 heterogeneous nuclear ribonucleoprotein Q [Erigeron canadensis]
MPRTRAKRTMLAVKVEEPPTDVKIEKPSEPEEQVDFDGDNEDTGEEEVEYEEVEEEVEEEEEEEEEEEVEEEEEEEEEDEEDDVDAEDEHKVKDEEMEYAEEEEDLKKIHDKLLALPPYGSEVYLGGIPLDSSGEDLKEFCESIGEVTEVRIMKDKDASQNKGYAFVTFRTKDLASTAIKELNNKELKGKKVKCSTSQAKHKLFIGNVPKNWTLDDMEKVVKNVGPGINSVELLKDPQNSRRNRGFAFIEYYNHACAEYSRQKMLKPKFKLDDNAPTVSWADPKNAESSAASSQVKAVYVKNLPKDVTQDQLEKIFEHHGKISKVVLPPAKAGHEKSRFGFVHFAERSSVMKALKNTEKYELNGQVLECSLAKPQADQKSSGGSSSSQKAALLPSYPPRVGYGLVGSPYGALSAGYGAGYTQPLIYGRGPSTAGMAMMPMLLPDGRIGYVLQQPGVQPLTPPPALPQHQRRGSGRSGGGNSGGSRSGGGNSGGGRSGGGNSSGGRSGGSGSGGPNRRGNNDSGGRGRSRYNPY